MILKKLRITVDSWTDDHIIAVDGTVVVNIALLPTEYLYRHAQLNLLLCDRQTDNSLLPQHIVLDPDFLVDVTAICRCFTPHGDAPAMYLLQKFKPSVTTSAILLGNAANQFLDDCLNAPTDANLEKLYQTSLHKSFRADALRFATTDGIDADFSRQCRNVFEHIHTLVQEQLPKKATLESAFLCEALGIQGRIDLMSNDHHTMVELKSGKAQEHGSQRSFRYEHAMQMALYKESLYYNENLSYDEVSTLLFYARYPELMEIHLGRKDIHRAVSVRNGIVHLEHLLRQEPARLLGTLTEAHFNIRDNHDRLYMYYLRPSILSFLLGIRQGTPLARTYFYTMLAFVEREQFLAKTGIEGVNVSVGHAGFADTWRSNRSEKMAAGRLIPDLRLISIQNDEGIELLDAVTPAIDESSNFRVGDLVMLYEQNRPNVSQPATFYISCVIEHFTSTTLRLRLRFPQHDASLFHADALYAIEPAHADAGYTILYRGLYAFLQLSSSRQQLILGERVPRFDRTDTLRKEVADSTLREILLHARQARDYYLLVGPPGTGKTHFALRAMVQEFGEGLLLTAFTNRAVDEICAMLTSIHAEYLRLGPELSCAPEHRGRLLNQLIQDYPTRTSIRELLKHIPVIVGTLTSLSSMPELFRLRHFRAAIVDEASQVLEPQLLPLLTATDADGNEAIEKFILIGDHHQLSAVVMQSSQESTVATESLRAIGLTDCRHSFFERLHNLALRQGVREAIGMLDRQGRMHDEIASFISHHYYNDCLRMVPLPHQTNPLPYPLQSSLSSFSFPELLTHRLIAYDVSADAVHCTAKGNPIEAQFVADIVQAIVSITENTDWGHRLGIIVPFRGQISLIRRSLAANGIPDYTNITIDTVERYQGSQRDIIIFSTTVSAPWQLSILSQPVDTDGLLLDRKLNVAITRARLQFILVGNHSLLRQAPAYRQFLDEVTS